MYDVWKKEKVRVKLSGQIEGNTPEYKAVRKTTSVLRVYFGRLNKAWNSWVADVSRYNTIRESGKDHIVN